MWRSWVWNMEVASLHVEVSCIHPTLPTLHWWKPCALSRPYCCHVGLGHGLSCYIFCRVMLHILSCYIKLYWSQAQPCVETHVKKNGSMLACINLFNCVHIYQHGPAHAWVCTYVLFSLFSVAWTSTVWYLNLRFSCSRFLKWSLFFIFLVFLCDFFPFLPVSFMSYSYEFCDNDLYALQLCQGSSVRNNFRSRVVWQSWELRKSILPECHMVIADLYPSLKS